MRFGPNTPLIYEVIAYATAGRVIAGAYSGDKSVIETDLDKAKERAWTQDPNEGEEIWADLRAQQKAQVLKKRYTFVGFDAADRELVKLSDELRIILSDRLHGQLADLLDDVASDLYYIAWKRAVLGTETEFFETVFEAYKAGGWPCGWRGSYPTGSLIVFSVS